MLTTTNIIRIAAAVLALLVVVALASALLSGSRAKVEARLNGNRADAAIGSGEDAVRTVGNQAAAETATDAITRENDHAIRSAPGADAPVDPAASDAGLRGLCRRAAYRRDPRCLQFTPAR